MEALVDGRNRRARREQVEETFRVARAAYDMARAPEQLRIGIEPDAVDRTAAWLLAASWK